MFKVIGVEIKKMLSKFGIYALSIFLAIILILGVFVYNPKSTQVKYERFTLSGNTFTEKYISFSSNQMVEADNAIVESQNLLNNYYIEYQNETKSVKDCVDVLTNKTKELFDEYRYNGEMSIEYNKDLKNNLSNTFYELNSLIERSYLLSSDGSFVLLSTEKNFNNYLSAYKNAYDWSRVKINSLDNVANDCNEFITKYSESYYTSIEDFIFPILTKEVFDNYQADNGISTKAFNSRIDCIVNQINTQYLDCSANTDKNLLNANEMEELANKYVNVSKTFEDLIRYELICNAFKTVPTAIQLDIKYLNNYSSYNANSNLTRLKYIFENNKTEVEYATPLTIGTTSNYETNAYDYAYFVLRLFAFVIIFYAIMAISRAFAGELKDGTMRYLAIRPVSRNEIYFGKLIAVLIISAILIVFSSIIALAVGGAVFGFESLKILTIFNGNVAFEVHPIGMLAIYLLSLFIEILVYVSFAAIVSILFKSDILAVTLTVTFCLINLLLPVFIAGPNTWLSFYPFSHISIYSLFGSSMYAPAGDFFNSLLGAKVYALTCLPLTIGILLVVIIVTNLIAMKLFKHKEI